MRSQASRRNFLQSAAAAGLAGSFLDTPWNGLLRRVSAEEAAPQPGAVKLRPEIEPLVKLLEDTPRERVLEEVAARIRGGLNYQDLLAALLLAGVRNIQPRPVGFKFHAVLVVNSAHLASIASPDEHRWLPIFWESSRRRTPGGRVLWASSERLADQCARFWTRRTVA